MINYSDKNIGDQFTAADANEIKSEHNTLETNHNNIANPAAAYGNLHNAVVWDSFQRADGAVGTAESGQTYTDLVGDGFSIINKTIRTNTGGNITGVSFSSLGSQTGLSMRVWGTTGLSYEHGLVIAIDANNYVVVKAASGGSITKIEKVVSGSSTSLLSTNHGTPREESGVWYIEASISLRAASGEGRIHARQQFRPAVKVDDADAGNIYENMTFAGLYMGQSFQNGRLYCWTITQVNK